jgi:hypothetical protein
MVTHLVQRDRPLVGRTIRSADRPVQRRPSGHRLIGRGPGRPARAARARSSLAQARPVAVVRGAGRTARRQGPRRQGRGPGTATPLRAHVDQTDQTPTSQSFPGKTRVCALLSGLSGQLFDDLAWVRSTSLSRRASSRSGGVPPARPDRPDRITSMSPWGGDLVGHANRGAPTTRPHRPTRGTLPAGGAPSSRDACHFAVSMASTYTPRRACHGTAPALAVAASPSHKSHRPQIARVRAILRFVRIAGGPTRPDGLRTTLSEAVLDEVDG